MSFRPKKDRAKSNMTRTELENANDAGKAMPDMVLKRHFFNAQENMVNAEANLMAGHFKNGKFYSEIDIIRFRSTILVVFRLISGMINAKNIRVYESADAEQVFKRNKVKDSFELCNKLVSYSPLDVPSLVHLAGYLNFCLHETGLTDLLMSDGGAEIDIAHLV